MAGIKLKRGRIRSLPRDLHIAALARSISVVGAEIADTALLLRLYEQGGSGWAIAGLLAAASVPMVVLAPVLGLVVDRYDSRILIVVTGLWQAAGCVLLVFTAQPLAVIALVAFVATGSAVANPVFGALTKVVVPDEQMSAASSLQQGGTLIATLAGPPLGGLLYGLTGGSQEPLLIAAGTFLAITAAGLLIRTRRRPEPTEGKQRASAGLSVIIGDPALFAVTVLSILIIVLGTAVGVAEPFLVLGVFQASAVVFGLLGATFTLGMLVGTAYASRLDSVRRILVGIPVGAAVLAISFALIGLINSLVAVFVLFVFAGAGGAVSSVASGTLLLLRTPEAVVGRVLASYSAILRGAGLIAYGLAGVVVGLLPPDTVFLLCGTAVLLAVLATAPVLRRARRLNPDDSQNTLAHHE
jgi:MFS family permease